MSIFSMIFGKKKEQNKEPKKIELDKNLIGILQGKSNELDYFMKQQKNLTAQQNITFSKSLEDVYLELQQKIKEEAVRILPTDFFIDCLRKYLLKDEKNKEEEKEDKNKKNKTEVLEKAVELIEKLEELQKAKKGKK